MKSKYWVVWNSGVGKWQVKKKISSVSLKNFDTKDSAKDYALELAKNNLPSQVTSKKKDGTVDNEWNFDKE